MDRTRLFVLCLALAFAAGCGGGGSSFDSGAINSANNTAKSSGASAPDSGDLSVFVTDNLNSDYDHVWVAIKKIDLKLAAGGNRTIFEDGQGVGVDLSSLRDETGPRYRFLNGLTIPAGTYTAAQITLAKDAILFPTNSVRGHATEFGEPTLSVTFDPPKMLGTGHDDLVLDFDLSQWKEEGGKLLAVVKPSLGAGLEDADRLAPTVHRGTVESIKGELPEQTFRLKVGKSDGVTVMTSATTALLGPSIARGQTVEVLGKYDSNTRRLDATSIQVEDPKAAASATLLGTVSAIDSKAGSWTTSPHLSRGFVPGMTTVATVVPESAKLFGASGVSLTREAFFKSLSGGKAVAVLAEGSYDAEKVVFTATEARLADPQDQPEVKLGGAVLNPKADDQTFAVTIDSFEGLLTRAGAQSTVAITPTTTFSGDTGQTLTSEQFFAALASPKLAQVEGIYDSSTKRVLASTIKLSPAPTKQAPKLKAKK